VLQAELLELGAQLLQLLQHGQRHRDRVADLDRRHRRLARTSPPLLLLCQPLAFSARGANQVLTFRRCSRYLTHAPERGKGCPEGGGKGGPRGGGHSAARQAPRLGQSGAQSFSAPPATWRSIRSASSRRRRTRSSTGWT